MSWINARATSFATYQDLVSFIEKGRSLATGDNGRGYQGMQTATTNRAIVAIPRSEMVRKWGNAAKANGKPIIVEVEGRKPINAVVGDIAPEGIIDLNPGALVAMGYDDEQQLSAPARWRWDQ